MFGAQRLLMMLTLLRVPSIHEDQNLTIRANSNGLTVLLSSKFRSRYTGCKKHAVDINGKFWNDANELKKSILGDSDAGKKKPRNLKKAGVEKKVITNDTTAKVRENDAINTDSPAETTEVSTSCPQRTYKLKKSIIRQRLLTYIRTGRGKKELYFWTVTFPQGLADDVAYKIYNIWLTSLRQYSMLKEYLWIAERQENGTIHFHIAIPHKMPVKRANAMMAGTLKTFSRRGEIPFSIDQCKKYNGVDIAKHRKTKKVTNFAIKKGSRSLITYLTKYVTKNNTSFTHLAWHNSRGFSSLFTGVTFTAIEATDHGFHLCIDYEKAFESEFFIFYPWCEMSASNAPPKLLLNHIDNLNDYAQSQN
jgi:hypothetical protein